MRYFVISGEASGDLHGAKMIREIKKLDTNAQFCFWGGDLMQEQAGVAPLKHYKNLAFMGFLEVVKHLPEIMANFKLCKQSINQYKPDVVILIDYPGFNLRMAKYLKQKGYAVYYYISPSVWAWHKSRVFTIKEFVDKLFVIYPFEEAFYKKFDYQVYYVGNPVADQISEIKNSIVSFSQFKEKNQLNDNPKIAVFGGSRMQELKKILEPMLQVSRLFPDHEFLVSAVANIPADFYSQLCSPYSNVKVLHGQNSEIMKYSAAGLIKSGTGTLEAALWNLPQVVCYKTSGFTYQIAKHLAKIKYISIVNIIMDKPVVKELIQHECTPLTMKAELNELLFNNDKKNAIFEDYKNLENLLGGGGASTKLANQIVDGLKSETLNE